MSGRRYDLIQRSNWSINARLIHLSPHTNYRKMIVIAIGKNYVNTREELPVTKGAPVIFTKPESSVLTENAPFHIPKIISNVAYEVELAFRVHKRGRDIARSSAMDYVDAVGLAIDFTAKDLLNSLVRRKAPGPWPKDLMEPLHSQHSFH